MTLSPEPPTPLHDYVHQQLLIATSKLIEIYSLGYQNASFRDAQYDFLWFTSLANTEALGAAYDLMCKDGACFEMPIDSIAAFGRIYIAAIAPNNPERATQVFENLIKLYADPGEGAHLEQIISNAPAAYGGKHKT